MPLIYVSGPNFPQSQPYRLVASRGQLTWLMLVFHPSTHGPRAQCTITSATDSGPSPDMYIFYVACAPWILKTRIIIHLRSQRYWYAISLNSPQSRRLLKVRPIKPLVAFLLSIEQPNTRERLLSTPKSREAPGTLRGPLDLFHASYWYSPFYPTIWTATQIPAMPE